MRVVCDIECDSLTPTIIHCIVCKDIDTGKVYSFILGGTRSVWDKGVLPLSMFTGKFGFAQGVTEWWGHNFLSYDAPTLNKLAGCNIKVSQIQDTLIMSRMRYTFLKNGHSLEAWGQRLGCPKIEFDDYSVYTEEMLAYCVQDVEVSDLLRIKMQKEMIPFSTQSIRLEHDVQYVLDQQMAAGFKLDEEKAHKLWVKIDAEANELEEEIKEFFQPITIETVFIPKRDNKTRGYRKDVPFIKRTVQEFNLKSPKQVNERLKPYWKPFVRTDGYKTNQKRLRDGEIDQAEFDKRVENSWSICEENLATLHKDVPQGVKNFAIWLTLNHRRQSITQWLDAVDENGRVHGYIQSVGASTHRCSHSGPNMANIPGIYDKNTGEPQLYGRECRELWVVDEGNVLVGTDASGIQLRVLAHYIGSDEYIAEASSGDVHTANKEALGALCNSRPAAKTFIYAWLLGAAGGKVASILGCSVKQAYTAMDNFVSNIKGLKDLLVRKSLAAKRGYMIGLDGRRIDIPSDHKALSMYLQGGESTIMKQAYVLWYHEATRRGIWFLPCAFVHDEWQAETRPEYAEELGEIQIEAIIRAGELLGCKCPLDGESNWGSSWAETH